MPNQEIHLTDRELLQAADGQLASARADDVRGHLAACWSCRARMLELESVIVDFVRAHQGRVELPPASGPRALLKARLAEAAEAPLSWRERVTAPFGSGRNLAYAATAAALFLVGVVVFQSALEQRSRLKPDPRLTPGAALPVTEAELCGRRSESGVRFIPASVGEEVFHRYGIGNPAPRAYELDYLIAPELGGSDDPRNFWPQPYAASRWNAHIKDALEDHLHQLVCQEKVSLETAQREIANDWISAYKKYFQTQEPMASHAAFTKDRPWE
jgi:hypothetical protein